MSALSPSDDRTPTGFVSSVHAELERQLAEVQNRTRSMLDTAEAENRDLSRRESALFRDLERQAESLLDKITDERTNPTQFQRQIGLGGGQEDRGNVFALTREQRFLDHYTERHGFGAYEASEVRDFSLGRVIRGMVTGQWDGADLERRALAEGTNAAGGFLTPEVLSASIIDRLRNKVRVIQAGARTVPVDSDEHSIPRLTGGASAAWRNENAPVVGTDPTFDRITFKPKSLATKVLISFELLSDSSPDAAQIVENELLAALALEVDRVALRGSGVAPEPRGVKNQSGVTVAVVGGGANGATPTRYTELMTAVTALLNANVDPTGIIMSPRSSQFYAGLTDTTNQPLNPPRPVADLPFYVTNQIGNAYTVGTSTDTSEVYVANWGDLMLGYRPQVGVSVDRTGPFAASVKATDQLYLDNLQLGVYAWLRMDVQLAHAESFYVLTGVRP